MLFSPPAFRLQVNRMTQEHSSGLLLTASGIQHRVPRRTVAPHPAQAFDSRVHGRSEDRGYVVPQASDLTVTGDARWGSRRMAGHRVMSEALLASALQAEKILRIATELRKSRSDQIHYRRRRASSSAIVSLSNASITDRSWGLSSSKGVRGSRRYGHGSLRGAVLPGGWVTVGGLRQSSAEPGAGSFRDSILPLRSRGVPDLGLPNWGSGFRRDSTRSPWEGLAPCSA
jgi:hypothetical protein